MAVSVDEMRGTITVHKTDSSNEPPKTFTFDTVFGPESKQLDVYNLTARPIIDSVLEGYNGKSLVWSQGSHLLFFALLEFLLILFKGVSPAEGCGPVLFLLWPLTLKKPGGTCCSEYSVVVPTMIINSGRSVMNKTHPRRISYMFCSLSSVCKRYTLYLIIRILSGSSLYNFSNQAAATVLQ